MEWTLWALLCFRMVAYEKPWKGEERMTHWRMSESEILPGSWVNESLMPWKHCASTELHRGPCRGLVQKLWVAQFHLPVGWMKPSSVARHCTTNDIDNILPAQHLFLEGCLMLLRIIFILTCMWLAWTTCTANFDSDGDCHHHCGVCNLCSLSKCRISMGPSVEDFMVRSQLKPDRRVWCHKSFSLMSTKWCCVVCEVWCGRLFQS